jgi:hypothetical protein
MGGGRRLGYARVARHRSQRTGGPRWPSFSAALSPVSESVRNAALDPNGHRCLGPRSTKEAAKGIICRLRRSIPQNATSIINRNVKYGVLGRLHAIGFRTEVGSESISTLKSPPLSPALE